MLGIGKRGLFCGDRHGLQICANKYGQKQMEIRYLEESWWWSNK